MMQSNCGSLFNHKAYTRLLGPSSSNIKNLLFYCINTSCLMDNMLYHVPPNMGHPVFPPSGLVTYFAFSRWRILVPSCPDIMNQDNFFVRAFRRFLKVEGIFIKFSAKTFYFYKYFTSSDCIYIIE